MHVDCKSTYCNTRTIVYKEMRKYASRWFVLLRLRPIHILTNLFKFVMCSQPSCMNKSRKGSVVCTILRIRRVYSIDVTLLNIQSQYQYSFFLKTFLWNICYMHTHISNTQQACQINLHNIKRRTKDAQQTRIKLLLIHFVPRCKLHRIFTRHTHVTYEFLMVLISHTLGVGIVLHPPRLLVYCCEYPSQ